MKKDKETTFWLFMRERDGRYRLVKRVGVASCFERHSSVLTIESVGDEHKVVKNKLDVAIDLPVKTQFTIRVRDFIAEPGGRDSAREFMTRSRIVDTFESALGLGYVVEVDLDGTRGYPASFLQHVFGTLSMQLGRLNMHRVLVLKSLDEPYLVTDVWSYVDACPDDGE